MSAAMAEDGPSEHVNKKKRLRSKPDPDKPKRKKVTKACIFCKRSHMTCTDNRPCDRCIKRDIAHLCADAPYKSGSATADADESDVASIAGSTRVSPQLYGAGSSSSTQQTQVSQTVPAETCHPWPKLEIDDAQLTQSLLYNGSPQSATSTLSQSDFFGSAQNGITTSASNNSPQVSNQLALDPMKPPNATPRTAFSSLSAGPGWPTATLGALAGPAVGTTSSERRQNRFQQHPSPLSAVSTLDSANRSSGQPYSNTHISTILKAQATHQIPQFSPSASAHSTTSMTPALASPQQQQTHVPPQSSPYNPFAILNQAYDFSYPSQNNSNSLASLKLFATTADPELGFSNMFGNDSSADLNFAQLPQMPTSTLFANRFGQAQVMTPAATSDVSGPSDIDSAALDEFLRTLDEMYLNPSPDAVTASALPSATSMPPQQLMPPPADFPGVSVQSSFPHIAASNPASASMQPSRSGSPLIGTGAHTPSSTTEKFLLTAADQSEGTKEERLNRVIRAKYEAGLLKPFNFIKGYERLNTWMDLRWSGQSKQRALRIISGFRPSFRAVATTLTDMDLIWIEESFERLLLDYDRVFTTMGIPACLWRRTGEIFKGNREFADLVGIPYEQMRDGKLAIYELMTEESAVNFWEKYGSIAFDPGQKAVLTSCTLVNQAKAPKSARRISNATNRKHTLSTLKELGTVSIPAEARITCTFSFTIRRDAYHIPNAIVGNFMAYDSTATNL